VPEYIRLIAAGRYSDAYMINWKSNVFPGILGRTCDRPCEPACRRGRVEEEPVAICRLKRVAADNKDDITRPPAARRRARRTASASRWSARAASLTVARDLRRSATLRRVRRRPKAGGMIRSQIPKFRLPEGDRRGGRLHPRPRHRPAAGQRIDSLKALLAKATTRSSSAPARRAAATSTFPAARKPPPTSISASTGCPASRSATSTKIGKRVIVLGGGNTAMDCCRTSRRLGGEDVKVIVRSGFEEMKASPWEKEDAMHEDIPILNFLVPKEFTTTTASSPA
jgi:formate dehydrogenase beta subunit